MVFMDAPFFYACGQMPVQSKYYAMLFRRAQPSNDSNSNYGDGAIGVGIGVGIGIDKTNGISTPIPMPTPTPMTQSPHN
jgi:hypothetical protein